MAWLRDADLRLPPPGIDGFCSQPLKEVFFLEPSNPLEGCPEFASLVDVDLASLLTIGLSELLASLQAFDASEEDATLTSEICGAIESKNGGESDFVGMEQADIRIVAKINWSTFPLDLERIGSIWKSVDVGATVFKKAVELVFSGRGSQVLSLWLWCCAVHISHLWWSWLSMRDSLRLEGCGSYFLNTIAWAWRRSNLGESFSLCHSIVEQILSLPSVPLIH